MGISTQHVYGRQRKFFANPESPLGTFAKPEATDAAKIIKADFNINVERPDRTDSRATRSLLERVTGKKTVGWNVEAEVIPSGTAGTPPDLHPLYLGALPAYSNSPGTSDTYAPSASQTIGGNTMCQHFPETATDPNGYMETIWGASVEEMSISVKTGESAKVKFSGVAMGFAATGNTTLNGAMVTSATMVVATATGRNISLNSVVKVAALDNTGAGYRVTVATARPSFTIESAISADTAATVYPFTPTETTAGIPLIGIAGGFTVDETTIPFQSFDITVKNNYKPLADEGLVQIHSDIIPGYRTVTGSVSFRARKDFIVELGKREDFGARALICTIGNVAGKRLVLTTTYAEFNFAAASLPEAEEGVITLPFVCLGSSGEDEISLAFT